MSEHAPTCRVVWVAPWPGGPVLRVEDMRGAAVHLSRRQAISVLDQLAAALEMEAVRVEEET